MKTGNNSLQNILLLAGVIVSCILMFVAGYFFRDILAKEQSRKPSKVEPTPVVSNTEYLPYNIYYDDSLIMVAKAAPHEAIVVSASRNEVLKKIAKTTRMSYFDGKKWDRKIAYGVSGDASIGTDSIVKKWAVEIDPSRVLKQSSTGTLQFGSNEITFDTGPLYNELGVRSLPGYTKFMSAGNGSFTLDGQKKEAYILYERIYSLNDKEIQFYDTPLAVTTYWLAFWGEDGSFYHLDKSEVGRPTQVYQTHQFGIEKSTNGSVLKSFDVSGSRDNDTAPSKFTFLFKQPIQVQISVEKVASLNKATAPDTVWLMNSVTGKIMKEGKEIKGIGLVELVKDN